MNPWWAGLRAQLSQRVSPGMRQHVRRLRRPAWPALLRRSRPVSAVWGFDRGTPVDRYFIERFLAEHRTDVQGNVLEVRDDGYTRRFGSDLRQVDILDIDPRNHRATIVADLTRADSLTADRFDCFILTQTLQFIFDVRTAVAHACRMLRPRGVLLATVPALSRLSPRYGLTAEYWRFTPAACTELFGAVFGPEQVQVHSYGSLVTATAFLMGLASEELRGPQLSFHDPYFPVLIAVRAVKRAAE